jgi:DNA adenine methylase
MKHTAEFDLTTLRPSEPVLRWAGSKRRIASILGTHAPKNFKRYVEPFVGSAALYFHLQPEQAILADVNPEVTTMYKAIKESPAKVHMYLQGIPRSREAYLQLREVSLNGLNDAQRAARLIFLMKGCFNGVYRTNQAGHFNVPFGSVVHKPHDLDALKRVSLSLQNAEIKTGDYKAIVLNAVRKDDFVYLDPPYSSSDRFRGEYGYRTTFRDTQVGQLIQTCNELTDQGAKVMLSYKWDQQLVDELPGWRVVKLNVPRSVGANTSTRSTAAEILALNY